MLERPEHLSGITDSNSATSGIIVGIIKCRAERWAESEQTQRLNLRL
jgi:hypothetical protein